MAPGKENNFRLISIGTVLYIFLLRFVYMGQIDLIPQEAYYWNYAQHLDIGYLDHPPMVAWLIWASTKIFGNSEFAVRIGANMCWLASLFFVCLLGKNLFDKSIAYGSAILWATLPFFCANGFFMTPDAPLVVFWTATLYFLYKALLQKNRIAWWGVGICLGLGMLSKYTIALLGLAIIVYVIVDRFSRLYLNRKTYYSYCDAREKNSPKNLEKAIQIASHNFSLLKKWFEKNKKK